MHKQTQLHHSKIILPLLESTTTVCPFPAPPQGSLTEALLQKKEDVPVGVGLW